MQHTWKVVFTYFRVWGTGGNWRELERILCSCEVDSKVAEYPHARIRFRLLCQRLTQPKATPSSIQWQWSGGGCRSLKRKNWMLCYRWGVRNSPNWKRERVYGDQGYTDGVKLNGTYRKHKENDGVFWETLIFGTRFFHGLLQVQWHVIESRS